LGVGRNSNVGQALGVGRNSNVGQALGVGQTPNVRQALEIMQTSNVRQASEALQNPNVGQASDTKVPDSGQSVEKTGYVFIGGDKLKANIGMRVLRRGEPSYCALLDAGVNWYEAENSCEFYIQEDKDIELVITPLTGQKGKLARITLEGLGSRINRMRMYLYMTGRNRLCVEIESLGFGEFVPPSAQIWREEMEII